MKTLNIITALAAALTFVACDDSEPEAPTREVWSPEATEVETLPVTGEVPAVGADCAESTLERWRYSYEEGVRVRAERFDGASDTPSRVEHYEQGPDFLRVRSTEGDHEVSVEVTFDASGELLRREVTLDGGQISLTEVVSADEGQRIVDFSGPVLLLEEADPMRSPDRDEGFEARIRGVGVDGDLLIDELVRRVNNDLPIDDFETLEMRETTTFDEGRAVRVEWDLTRDGQPNRVHVLAHSEVEGGREVRTEMDFDADGEIDANRVQRFDDQDRLLSERAAGVLLRELNYEGEHLVSELRLVMGEAERITHERSDELEITRVDTGDDGSVDKTTRLHLRADGQRILKQDEDAEGQVDWQKRYVYDEAGRRAFEERDPDVDGTPVDRWDYGYDAEGQLVFEVFTAPADAACAGLR